MEQEKRQKRQQENAPAAGTHKYTMPGVVRFSQIDHTGRMTLPAIVNRFQDCSIAQTESLGYSIEHMRKKREGWVLLTWQIIVERYARLGESIRTSTWAAGFKGALGDRYFSMEDADGNRIAYAYSLWLYMDLEHVRPGRPPKEELEAYGSEAPIEMARAPRKISIPDGMREMDRFPVRKYHIDTNEHVNNCQYVQMAMELYPENQPIRQVRVEYKKQAKYRDVLVAKAAAEGDRFVVVLSDEAGDVCAVVEFL